MEGRKEQSMSVEPKHVHASPDSASDLVELLDNASECPVIIERDGMLYRLSRLEDSLPDYDPDLARRALKDTAESWRASMPTRSLQISPSLASTARVQPTGPNAVSPRHRLEHPRARGKRRRRRNDRAALR